MLTLVLILFIKGINLQPFQHMSSQPIKTSIYGHQRQLLLEYHVITTLHPTQLDMTSFVFDTPTRWFHVNNLSLHYIMFHHWY